MLRTESEIVALESKRLVASGPIAETAPVFPSDVLQTEGAAPVPDEVPKPCSLTAKLWMWGFLVAFGVHDGEEAGYIIKQGGLEGFGVFQGTAASLTGILFELTLAWLFILLATRSGRPGWQVRLFAMLLSGWTLHGVQHIVEAIAGHGYDVGSATALPACVGYGVLALGVLYRERLLDRRWLTISVFGGGLIAVPFVALAHLYGSLLG